MTLLYGWIVASCVGAALWVAVADLARERRFRRIVQARLRQLRRTDAGFARGRA